MNPKVQTILEAVADNEQPWVWLPTGTEPDLWDEIARAARHEGYGVLDLDRNLDVDSHDALLQAFRDSGVLPKDLANNLNALKDALTGLPDARIGWVVLFRNPDSLCNNDPETFEALLDIVEVVNDIKAGAGRPPLSLITLDAEEDFED